MSRELLGLLIIIFLGLYVALMTLVPISVLEELYTKRRARADRRIRQPWTRTEILAVLAVLATILGVIVMVLLPEVRQLLRLQ